MTSTGIAAFLHFQARFPKHYRRLASNGMEALISSPIESTITRKQLPPCSTPVAVMRAAAVDRRWLRHRRRIRRPNRSIQGPAAAGLRPPAGPTRCDSPSTRGSTPSSSWMSSRAHAKRTAGSKRAISSSGDATDPLPITSRSWWTTSGKGLPKSSVVPISSRARRGRYFCSGRWAFARRITVTFRS